MCPLPAFFLNAAAHESTRALLADMPCTRLQVDGDVNNNAAALFAFANDSISLVEDGLKALAAAAEARGSEAAGALRVSSETIAAAAGGCW
jgi:hypothetical protein